MSIIIWSLPVLLAFLWQVLDTSPSLFVYDLVTGTPDLADKNIWVTGASSGIGAALVCEFAKAGARHVVLSARRENKMRQVIQTCQQQSSSSSNTTFSIVPYDALEVDSTEFVVRQAIDSTPNQSIDMLVLNSGIYQVKPALETTADERRNLVRVNLEAPMDLSQALLKMDHWKERGHGHLVVISSIMAKGPHGLCTTYAATKAAIRSYFQTLSAEEFQWLRVNMVLPGATATEMWKTSYGDTVQVDQSSMMTPQRVAQLTTKAIAGPTLLFWEVWISKANGLLYAFMSHYVPGLFYLLNHVVGWIRLAAYRRDQTDVIEIKNLVRFLFNKIRGKL